MTLLISLRIFFTRNHYPHYERASIPYTRSVKTVSNFFFCKNLVDFNKAHLHEATLNLHTHAWIFSHLSIASVDSKQHLSEIVFSPSSDFHCTARECTKRSKNHQRVLQQCPPPSTDAVRRKRSDLWSTGNWDLHHDNAPVHSSHFIQNFFLAKK